MKIPRKNCPPEFFVRSDDFKSFLFIAEIVQWDQVNYALGKHWQPYKQGDKVWRSPFGRFIESHGSLFPA